MATLSRTMKNASIGLGLVIGGIVLLKLAAVFHSWMLIGVAIPAVFYGLVKTSESLPGKGARPAPQKRGHRVPQTLR